MVKNTYMAEIQVFEAILSVKTDFLYLRQKFIFPDDLL